MSLLASSARQRVAFAIVAVAFAGGAAYAITRSGDRDEPASISRRGERADWPTYGYSRNRRRYFPAPSSFRPPFERRWKFPGTVLLEFPPVTGQGKLFLLRKNASVYAIGARTGAVRWKRRLGVLAASSPAYRDGWLYVTILQRGRGRPGRVVALSARDGKVHWSRRLPARTESSPLIYRQRVFFGTQDGSLYALHARTGRVAWKRSVDGAVKAALTLSAGKLYFGDYAGELHALRATDGSTAWSTVASSYGEFYSTAAVAYGRVYLGNTNGRVYAFSARNGRLDWSRQTRGYVYGSPAVARVPGGHRTVYIGSHDGSFYALNARSGARRWTYRSGGRISGAATVADGIVYFADLDKRTTYGLGARTGREVFRMRRGGYTPIVTDGHSIYLTGYSQQYALEPRKR